MDRGDSSVASASGLRQPHPHVAPHYLDSYCVLLFHAIIALVREPNPG